MRNTIDLLIFEIWRQDFWREWLKFLHLKFSASHVLAISGKLMIAMIIFLFIHFLNNRFNHFARISNSTRKFSLDFFSNIVFTSRGFQKFSKTFPSGTKFFLYDAYFCRKLLFCSPQCSLWFNGSKCSLGFAVKYWKASK